MRHLFLWIEQTGARVVHLPPYSPECNPLERAWALVKQTLRALKGRTKEAWYEAGFTALKTISPAHAKYFFEHTRKVST